MSLKGYAPHWLEQGWVPHLLQCEAIPSFYSRSSMILIMETQTSENQHLGLTHIDNITRTSKWCILIVCL